MSNLYRIFVGGHFFRVLILVQVILEVIIFIIVDVGCNVTIDVPNCQLATAVPK